MYKLSLALTFFGLFLYQFVAADIETSTVSSEDEELPIEKAFPVCSKTDEGIDIEKTCVDAISMSEKIQCNAFENELNNLLGFDNKFNIIKGIIFKIDIK